MHMQNTAMPDLLDGFRWRGRAQRASTLAPLVPSQETCRYQAKDVPPPIYDLDRKRPDHLLQTMLVPALVIGATGAGIVLVQSIGMWLSR
jgi:hypothetical protein